MVGDMVREEYRRQAIELLTRFTPMGRDHAGQLADMLVALAHATAPIEARRQAHRSHAAFWSPDARAPTPAEAREALGVRLGGAADTVRTGTDQDIPFEVRHYPVKGPGHLAFDRPAAEAHVRVTPDGRETPYAWATPEAMPLVVLRQRFETTRAALIHIHAGCVGAVDVAEAALREIGVVFL